MSQDTVDSSIQRPHPSEFGFSDTHDETRIDFNGVSAEIISSDNSQNPLQAGKPSHQSVCENLMCNFLANAFKKSGAYVEDVVDDQEIDELPPPGFEENARSLVPSHICKFRPSRSDECVPKIGEYVAMAMCRQKLHDDVLREWKSMFADGILHQFLISLHASKHRASQGNEVWIC